MKPSDDFTGLHRFESVRKRSLALATPLSDEDCGAQSMPDASPVKWHLAHTTWFFETFILEQLEQRFEAFDPAFRVLFNSYYNGIGDRHPRARRGLLTRPSLSEVRAYRADVDERIKRLLATQGDNPQLAALIELGLQHEQQHQELILTDVQHLFAQNELNPAYVYMTPFPAATATALQFVEFAGGVAAIGHASDGFCFDNELPRHRQFVEPFALADRLVTNGEYLAFIDAGGYRDASLWLSEGWDQVNALSMSQPMYWRRDERGQWCEFTLYGLRQLDLSRPVSSVSLYEADAYATWAGARLPTEFEWELAEGQSDALREMFGHCWQWTSSSFAPYPGYRKATGALGEYNGKFMLNQYVLRGSSSATPSGHSRATYRNFFSAGARWQFTGIRLAK